MGLFSATGQTSSSTSNQQTQGEGAVLGSDNISGSQLTTSAMDGGIAAQGNVVVNQSDGGILDTAGQITGQSLALLGHVFDTALGAINRTVETGFGSAERATETVARTGNDAAAAIAAAKGLDTVSQWRRYVPYLIGAAVLIVGVLAFRWKGKHHGA